MFQDPHRPLNSTTYTWFDKKALQKVLREERAEARAKRTAEQQLALLDERLGVGLGAKREREKLAKEISGKNK